MQKLTLGIIGLFLIVVMASGCTSTTTSNNSTNNNSAKSYTSDLYLDQTTDPSL